MKSAVQMESEPMTLLECLGQCDEARSEAGALRDALDAVVPEIELLRANARELDRLMLVIESAVRHSDPINHAAVMALILANRDSVSKMTPNV